MRFHFHKWEIVDDHGLTVYRECTTCKKRGFYQRRCKALKPDDCLSYYPIRLNAMKRGKHGFFDEHEPIDTEWLSGKTNIVMDFYSKIRLRAWQESYLIGAEA